MLESLPELPDGVLGYRALGEIVPADYEDVLLPAVRATWERGEDIRIVLVFERWDGMASGSMRKDLKLGFEHLRGWKRLALVTDLDWMVTVASLFGWMPPGELKRFPVADLDRAIAWAAGGSAD